MSKSALMVVEGGRTEVRLFSRLLTMYLPSNRAEIYTYNTTLYELAEQMFQGDELDDDLDLIQVLKESKTGPADRKVLEQKFTDIYLVFDFDPHYQKCNFDRLKKLCDFFNDSTSNGKLYLNFPMVESYRHFKALDESYLSLGVRIEDIPRYKEIVGAEGCSKLAQLSKISKKTFNQIIILNLKKAEILVQLPAGLSIEEGYSECTMNSVLEKELDLYKKGLVLVLNTSLFVVIDYNPSRFFGGIFNMLSD